MMNISYCYEYCQKGVSSVKKFLQSTDSIFEAASDFQLFTEDCFKTCPHKLANTADKINELSRSVMNYTRN